MLLNAPVSRVHWVDFSNSSTPATPASAHAVPERGAQQAVARMITYDYVGHAPSTLRSLKLAHRERQSGTRKTSVEAWFCGAFPSAHPAISSSIRQEQPENKATRASTEHVVWTAAGKLAGMLAGMLAVQQWQSADHRKNHGLARTSPLYLPLK